MKLGLALGGGAARGLAHLGILKVLKEEGVPVDVVAGTSMGAIIGSLFVAFDDLKEITDRVTRFLTGPLFYKMRLGFFKQQLEDQKGGIMKGISNALKKGMVYTASMSRASYIRHDMYMQVMESVLPDVQIQDLRKPLAVVATSLQTGKEVVIRSGSLRVAVAASSAIPGLLPPITMDGQILVDGGWIDQVPVRPARELGADFVLAVDVGEELDRAQEFERSLDIINRANFVARKRLMRMLADEGDIVWRPAMKQVHWADFSQFETAFKVGEELARSALADLRKSVSRAKVRNVFAPLMPWKK